MWRFKSCPKCNGDLFVDRDIDGWVEQCLQCGHTKYLETIYELEKQPAAKKREPALAGNTAK